MSVKRRDREFVRTALKLRLVTPEQIKKSEEVLNSIREQNPKATLAEILLGNGYITKEEAKEIFDEMLKEAESEEPEAEEKGRKRPQRAVPRGPALKVIIIALAATLLVVIASGLLLLVLYEPKESEKSEAENPQPVSAVPQQEQPAAVETPPEEKAVEEAEAAPDKHKEFLDALAEAERFADENPTLFRSAITKLLEAVAMDPTSIEAGRAREKIAQIEKQCELIALKAFTERKAKGDELAGPKKFGEAITVFDDFPSELRTGRWEAAIGKCVEGYKATAQRLFDEEAAKAAKLTEEKKYNEACAIYESLKELGLEDLTVRAQDAIAEVNDISRGSRDRECEARIQEIKRLMFSRVYREAVRKCDEMLKDPAFELHRDRIQLLFEDAALLENIWNAAQSAVPKLQGKQLTIAGVTGTIAASTLDEIIVESGKGQVKKKFVDLSPDDILMIAKQGEEKQAALGSLHSGVFLLYGMSLTAAEKQLLLAQKEGKEVSRYLRLLAMLKSEMEAAKAKGPTRNNPPDGMVYVPAGEFLMGSASGPPDERPVRRVFLDAYFIDRYEVTNEEYKKFIDETKRTPPPYWKDGTFPEGKAKHPVVMVSWEDAAAYAAWRGKRLPTEAEWEKAARGITGKEYPWGETFRRDKCQSAEQLAGEAFKDRNQLVQWLDQWQKAKKNQLVMRSGGPTVSVDSNRSGASPYGLCNMAGNAREWVADFYDENCYRTALAINPKGPEKGEMRVIRGGSWQSIAVGGDGSLRCPDRDKALPFEKLPDCGFRCALDAPIEEVEYALQKYERALGVQSQPSPEPVEAAAPIIKPPEGMVCVPEGPFTMGSDDGAKNEAPPRRVHLSAYFIDKCEVTNEDYKKFVDQTKHEPPPYWQKGAFPEGKGKCPVTGVTYEDAAAYARWAGKRLPTEAEWEKAARGTAGRRYPWGDEFDPARAQCAERVSGRPIATLQDQYNWYQGLIATDDGKKLLAAGGATVPVGSFDKGASPFGCYDMAGNVAEWVSDWFSEEYYETAPELDPKGPPRGEMRVVRGGSWDGIGAGSVASLRCADREGRLSGGADARVGFRCAMSAYQAMPSAQAATGAQPPRESLEEAVWKLKKLIEKVVEALGKQKEFFTRDTKHFIIASTLGPEPTREASRYCEDLYERMCKVLGIEKETSVWRGKCMVYLFASHNEYLLFGLDIDNMTLGERSIGYISTENGWIHIAVTYPHVEPPKEYAGSRKKTTDEMKKEYTQAQELAAEQFKSELVSNVIHAFVSSCKGGSPMKPWVTLGLVQCLEHAELPNARVWENRRKIALDAVANWDNQSNGGQPHKPGEFFDKLRSADRLSEEQRALAWSAVEFMVQKQPKKFIEFFNILKNGQDDDEALLRGFGTNKLVSAYEEEMKKSKPDQTKVREMLDRTLAEFEALWLEGMRKIIKEDEKKGIIRSQQTVSKRGKAAGAKPVATAQTQTREDFDSFRVRRITIHVSGKAENPEVAIPEQAMVPLDVILQVRRKGYEVIEKPVDDYPATGVLGIVYEVTQEAKDGGGGQAAFEVAVKGQVFLRSVQKNVVLWGAECSAKQQAPNSERISAELIEKLVADFYKDDFNKSIFDTLPKAPKFTTVVGSPYKFPAPLTPEPMRPARDTISTGRIMREILGGRWEGSPKPIHHVSPSGGDPVIQMWNNSDEQLTICYQGVTDVDIVLAPDAKLALRLAPGLYKIGARTAAPEIVPFYNSETLQPSKTYSIRFSTSKEGY